jgi:phage baseplate assembly protein gpV
MGVEQFSQVVAGSNGGPVATSTQGTVQTDNYGNGDAFDYDGSAYPYSIDPAETIQELTITAAGDIIVRITTVDGDTFDLPLAGSVGVWDKWSIDSVEFRDPNGTTARIAGGWAGE